MDSECLWFASRQLVVSVQQPQQRTTDVVRDCGDKRRIKKQKLPPHPQAPGGDTAEGSLL